MRGAPDPIRLGALAAMVGGAMWVAKGGLVILGILDLGGLLSFAELFFEVGLVGLHAWLEERGGRTGSVAASWPAPSRGALRRQRAVQPVLRGGWAADPVPL